jgi:hypothetical protein
MNPDILTLILAALLGLIPNLIIKWFEKRKSKEDITKINIDSAVEVIKVLREHNEYLENKIDKLELENCDAINKLNTTLEELYILKKTP